MELMGPMGQRHWNATTPVSSKVRILNPNWNVKQSDPPFLVSSCAFVSEQPDRVSGSSGSSLTTANCLCEKLSSAAMCGMHDVQIVVGFSKWGELSFLSINVTQSSQPPANVGATLRREL